MRVIASGCWQTMVDLLFIARSESMGQEPPNIITNELWPTARSHAVTEKPAGIFFASLLRRRTWYADGDSGTPPSAPSQDAGKGNSNGGQSTGKQADGKDKGQDSKSDADSLGPLDPQNPQQLMETIGSLRTENAAWRKKLTELQAERDKEEAARKKAEEEELSKQGEFKTLAEQRAAEIEALKPKAERADALLERLQKQNEARIAKIPEEMRTVVPVEHMDPVALSEWLDANEEKLAGERAPSLDGGKRGTGKKKIVPDPSKALNKRRRGF